MTSGIIGRRAATIKQQVMLEYLFLLAFTKEQLILDALAHV